MKRILLSGYNGKMGRVVAQTVSEREDCVVVAGFDIHAASESTVPVYAEPTEFEGAADVLIDFSHPSYFPKVLGFASARRMPVVVATTGLSTDQRKQLQQLSQVVPVFSSANMSLGVNLILELCKKAAAVLSDSFDIEVVEMHHNQKIDAPSGTALMLADGIASVLPQKPHYMYDRHSQRKKREKNEIGIHSVRGGTIVGEHEVLFAGTDEVIAIRHSASSKRIFATGAINAALFLSIQKPGLYDMSHLVSAIGG
ncbi:MAG: 4-hydroxy-tetrahydrodipicolinate reductase [Ethanoligenens sp.]|uniref:4-hydroxy-tetrahydrodipicolinate reductase n=1 Tax=Ethanoligenens sp. TaxID=2099655 RepID=UPI0039E807AB